MAKVPFNVSVYDMNHVLSQVGKTVDDLSKEELEEILYSVGMDKKGVLEEVVLHRPKLSPNNSPWFGKRYTGWERQDKEWLFGKWCTLDNIISRQSDLEHTKDLMKMSKQANYTLTECEFAEAVNLKR